MILDIYTKALEKDLAKITWLPTATAILTVIIRIIIIIVLICHFFALFRIRKETIKIRKILEKSTICQNDDSI